MLLTEHVEGLLQCARLDKVFGCYDIYTFDLSAFSMVHQATEAGPLTGQRMDIAEVACPSIGLIPIEGVPIDPLELGICEDLHFTGQPFNADVRSTGATTNVLHGSSLPRLPNATGAWNAVASRRWRGCWLKPPLPFSTWLSSTVRPPRTFSSTS